MSTVPHAINTCSLSFCFSDSKFLSNNSILFKRAFVSFSNIFECSVVLRRSFNDRYDTTEELEFEADSILEERFEEVDFEDNFSSELNFPFLSSLHYKFEKYSNLDENFFGKFTFEI